MTVVLGPNARKVHVYVRLVAHAERGQQHHGDKRHDDHHQIHGVLANNVRHAAKHHGQVGRHQAARDERERHAAQHQQRGDGVERRPLGLVDIALHVLSRGVDARKLGEPLAPEEERRGRAKGKHHDHEHVAGLGKRHQGAPLGHEHAKRRHKHAHDAQHHQTRQVRHAAEHAVHVLDIAAADMMLGRAHAQEQQRLGHRVEQDQEDGGPHSLGRADAQTGTDEAQVGDGGIRKHALGVALRDGHEGGKQKRDGAHAGDHKARHGIGGVERTQLDHQEHAGLDHGRRVKQRTGRRGGDHGTQQPSVERHLCGLGERGERQQDDRHNQQRRLHGAGAGKLDHAGDGHRHAVEVQEHKTRQKRDAAQHVEDDLGEGVFDGLGRARVANHEERAHGGDFPTAEQPLQVVARHDDEHGREEQEHERQELRATVGRGLPTQRGLVLVMGLEVLHVAQGIHTDEAADDADGEDHDHAHVVQVERRSGDDLDRRQRHGRKGNGTHQLHYAKYGGEHALIFVCVAQDDGAQNHIDNGADDREHMRGVGGDLKALRTRAKKDDGDYNRRRHNDAGAYQPYRIAGAVAANEQHAQRRYQRKQGKEIQ